MMGEPEYELVPDRETTFSAKNVSSMRFAFQLDASGAVVGVALTGPQGVFDAPRKA